MIQIETAKTELHLAKEAMSRALQIEKEAMSRAYAERDHLVTALNRMQGSITDLGSRLDHMQLRLESRLDRLEADNEKVRKDIGNIKPMMTVGAWTMRRILGSGPSHNSSA